MKGIKRIIILAFMAYAALAIFKYKHVSTTNYYKTTTQLNVRTGAGLNNPVSFILEKEAEVEVIDKGSSWYKIKHSDKVGYANSKYLNYSRSASDKTVFTPQQKTNIKLSIIIGLLVFVVLPVGLKLFIKVRNNKLLKTVTELNRGTKTERELILKLLKYGIPSEAIFHDLYVSIDDANFSQIDLVAITSVGIIVFEVKDYKGWIYGRGKDYKWTQVLAYGKKKYQFYNPIMQNNKHIEHLKNQLPQFATIPFYSILVFYGDCNVNNIDFVPNNTFIAKPNRIFEVINSIINSNYAVQYENINEILSVLNNAVNNGRDRNIQMQHTTNIRNMLGKDRIFD